MHTDPPAPSPFLDERATACLARGLDEVEAFTSAPLRVCAHASGPDCEVFELQEEFELGPPGRRFVVTVARPACGAPPPPDATRAAGLR